jgi:hypothetical protein
VKHKYDPEFGPDPTKSKRSDPEQAIPDPKNWLNELARKKNRIKIETATALMVITCT